MEGNLYQLHVVLEKPANLTIGKLGSFYFPSGNYIYTGSAKNSLEGRINRHLRVIKKFHWHIDYLLLYGKIENVKRYLRLKSECELHYQTLIKLKGEEIIKGFGSSDCKCKSHLIYLKALSKSF